MVKLLLFSRTMTTTTTTTLLLCFCFCFGLLLPSTAAASSCLNTDNGASGLYIANYGITQIPADCAWLDGLPEHQRPSTYCDKIVSWDNTFFPHEMCCLCGGGESTGPSPDPTPAPTVAPTVPSTCHNTDYCGVSGLYIANHGNTQIPADCAWFDGLPEHQQSLTNCDKVVSWDDTFFPYQMCCACGGGISIPDTEDPPPSPECPPEDEDDEDDEDECVDTPDDEWTYRGKSKKTCSWLSDRPIQKQQKICKKKANKGSSDKTKVYAICKATCHAVDNPNACPA